MKLLFYKVDVIKLFGESASVIFQEGRRKSITLEFQCLDNLLVLCLGAVVYMYRNKQYRCDGRVSESGGKSAEIRRCM